MSQHINAVAKQSSLDVLNSNVALMDMIAVCSSGFVFAGVSLLNCNGSLRSNNIFVKYNDKYVAIVGAARYNDITRTGANPGIIITLPVPVKSADFGGIVRIPTANENEYANMAASNQEVIISITESTTNYTATTLSVEIPYIVFERA